jgi:hypothetical protein
MSLGRESLPVPSLSLLIKTKEDRASPSPDFSPGLNKFG